MNIYVTTLFHNEYTNTIRHLSQNAYRDLSLSFALKKTTVTEASVRGCVHYYDWSYVYGMLSLLVSLIRCVRIHAQYML